MELSFTERKSIRRNFGKLKESLSIPNLIEVQKNSYKQLTEFNENLEQNLTKGFDRVFKSIFPIEDLNDKATLEYDVLSSPESISKLANEYLEKDLVTYKKSQIKHLDEDTKTIFKINEKDENLSKKIKSEITQKIAKKKTELRKLQELYSNPGELPGAIKTQVAMKIERKKIELKNIYNEPKDIFTLERVGRWSVIQVVKLFLGMPIIPGK